MEIIKSQNKISIRQIFLSNQAWLHFWAVNVFLLRWAIIWNIAKMLLCRNGWGYQTYSCFQCGTYKFIPNTCKSRFCSSCGKVAGDKWVEKTFNDMLDVSYKHLFFTIPKEFRIWFKYNRKAMLKILSRAINDTLLEYGKKRGYKPGIISVLHTFGADLKWNPHIHVIITAGGLSINNDKWITNVFFPQKRIRSKYRFIFLKLFKALFKKKQLKLPKGHRHLRNYRAFNSWLTQFYKKEWFVRLGKTLKEKKGAVRYIGRYTKRPVLAEYRILAFNGKTVTFTYIDRATGENEIVTLTVSQFIGNLVQHIPDMYFRNINHAGIFANCVRTKKLEIARKLLNQDAESQHQPLSYQQLYLKTFGIDPLICPKCRKPMILINVKYANTSKIRSRVKSKNEKLIALHPKSKPITSSRASP